MDTKLFQSRIILHWPNKELPASVDQEIAKNIYTFGFTNSSMYSLNVTSPEDRRDFPATITLMKKNNVDLCYISFDW